MAQWIVPKVSRELAGCRVFTLNSLVFQGFLTVRVVGIGQAK